MGKLAEKFINDIIANEHGYYRANVIAPRYGIDTSIIDLTTTLAMAIASDPLTYIASLGAKVSAWLSIQLVANDIATTSLSPQYGQIVLNLPDNITEIELRAYWYHIDSFAKDIGIAITGGHTGWAHGNRSTIAGGITLWAIGAPETMLLSSMVSPGETLLMTKSAAISSSAILAAVFPNYTASRLSTLDVGKLHDEMWNISVLKEAHIVRELNTVKRSITAMHDVTEGGILGAIYEMCTASKVGVELYINDIVVEPHIHNVCAVFDLDPLRSIGAGSMLISCNTEDKVEVIAAMESNDIRCTEIGVFTSFDHGLYWYDNGLKTELINHEQDPYWAVFNKAMNDGLS